LTSRGAFWGIFVSFVVGFPLSLYANITENPHLIVLAAVLSVALGLVVCLCDGRRNRKQVFLFEEGMRA